MRIDLSDLRDRTFDVSLLLALNAVEQALGLIHRRKKPGHQCNQRHKAYALER